MTTTSLAIPADARLPIAAPETWFAAAAAADWQCGCVTPEQGKSPCGKSHRDDENRRCRRRAVGDLAVHLVLAPDADGVTRLLCETCADGHARKARAKVAATAPEAVHAQDSLF